MIKILFICYGNICRSTMAEFVFSDLVNKIGCGQEFHIASAATSTEEIGNPVHPGTREVLRKRGISTEGKYAVQLKRADYEQYDYLIGMESVNIRNMLRILRDDPEGKVSRLLDFTNEPRDIDDPWYTGRFENTYRDVLEGCEALYDYIKRQ